MRVTRIGWAGTRTSEYSAMVAFLQTVLGLTASQEASDFAAFQLPEGGTFEVFGPGDQDHERFSTGPVVGFVVEDLTAAVRELEAAGVELLGGQMDERGGGWRHLRAPDGNIYELTSGQRGGHGTWVMADSSSDSNTGGPRRPAVSCGARSAQVADAHERP